MDSDEQEARRVCGAAGRTSGYHIDEDGQVYEPNMDSFFRRAA